MDASRILKGLGLYFLSSLLILSLLSFAYALVFRQVVAQPEKIKEIAINSDVYQQIPSLVYETYAENNSKSALGSVEVRQAALAEFNPDFVQKNIEAGIDGSYAWLEGKTDRPEFVLDLSEAKKRFAERSGEAAAKRATMLPICTQSQLNQISSFSFVNAPCLPSGADLEAFKQEFISALNQQKAFIGNTTVGPEDIKDSSGKNLFDSYSDAPKWFQLARHAAPVLALVILVVGSIVILLSPSKSAGLKRISRLLLSAGVLIILAPVFIGFTSNQALKNVASDELSKQIVLPLVQEFNKEVSGLYYLTGIMMLILAIACYLVARKIRSS